ncbi:hypothetical protein [Nocardioides sp. Soil805]|uniref:hypothetical protein n=1 Tax=Nocardioides sp. Soil805 TaxID=1736416 RepID=UPI000B127049|nr:hypothetical protein [Nocardioides sp. Soil805]
MPAHEGHGDQGHAAFVAARRDLLVAEHGGGPVAEAAVDRALARLRRGWRRLEREDDVEARVREQVELELDRPRRRRIARRAAGVLVLVVLAGVAWSLRPQPPAVAEETNPLPVPWYDGTELHLAEVAVTLPDLGGFAADGDGVLVERDGEVQRVDADGDLSSYDGVLDPAPEGGARPPDLNPADRVLQSVVAPDGTTLHLVEINSSNPDAGTYVRLSETGKRVFLVCRDGGCVTRLVESGARLR